MEYLTTPKSSRRESTRRRKLLRKHPITDLLKPGPYIAPESDEEQKKVEEENENLNTHKTDASWRYELPQLIPKKRSIIQCVALSVLENISNNADLDKPVPHFESTAVKKLLLQNGKSEAEKMDWA